MASWLVFDDVQLPYLMIFLAALMTIEPDIAAWELTLAIMAIILHPGIYAIITMSPPSKDNLQIEPAKTTMLELTWNTIARRGIVMPVICMICYVALIYKAKNTVATKEPEMFKIKEMKTTANVAPTSSRHQPPVATKQHQPIFYEQTFDVDSDFE